MNICGNKIKLVHMGQFHPGDLAVYFEIDAKVPEKEPFEFLASKKYKIKTQKYFSGTIISQGLLMAGEDFGWETKRNQAGAVTAIGNHKKGDFLTAELGVTYSAPEDNIRKEPTLNKYQKMEKRHPVLFKIPVVKWMMKKEWGKNLLFTLFGSRDDNKAAWPEWVVKTDEERVQNMAWILEDKSEWIATEKIDGTSTTMTLKKIDKKRYDFYQKAYKNTPASTGWG